MAVACARAAEEKKGLEIVVRRVGDLLGITDYFVFATGINRRQVQAIAEEVERRARAGGTRGRMEGFAGGWWVLVDLGSVVVHVLREEARRYYGLDHLWADAPEVPWQSARRAGASAV